MTEERDPKVSRRYRELGAEEPSRELDQAVLAAAHRAADRAHAPLVAPAGRHRWYFAFGAAAILVLAVAITVQVERQPDPEALPPSTVSVPPDRADRFYEKESKEQVEPSKPLADAGPPPARERRKAPAQQTAPAVPPLAGVKPEAAEVARADRLEARQQQAPSEMQNVPPAAPATPAPPPSAQTDSRDLSSSTAAGALFSRQGEASRSLGTAPAADQPASSPEAKARLQAKAGVTASIAPPLGPEQLLERIAELRQQGKHEEADKALAEFRQRYPEYRISEEMLKKVERPK
jgi:hypothetical protein